LELHDDLKDKVRVPIGKFLLELPAGMLDDEKGDFVGTAVRELLEASTYQLHLLNIFQFCLMEMESLVGFLLASYLISSMLGKK